MNSPMRRSLTYCLSMLLAASAFSQTRLIAHKSHSGSPMSYASDAPSGNFGNPPPIPRIIEKVNDTTVVVHIQEWSDTTDVTVDTLYNDPVFSNPNITVDSMRKTQRNGQRLRFRNFDQPERPTPHKPVQAPAPIDRPIQGPAERKDPERAKRSGAGIWSFSGAVLFGSLLAVSFFRSFVRRA